MKEMLKRGFAIALAAMLLYSASLGEPWHGITPLKSTRIDVERILGKENEHGFYHLEEGQVRVFYGAGLEDADTCWGRAAKDLVTEIRIDIEYPLNMKDLKADISKFKKTVDSEHPDNVSYVDWNSGIGYEVKGDEDEIYTIFYHPSKKDCDALLRGNRPAQRTRNSFFSNSR